MPELVDKWLSKWSPRTVLVGVLILSALPLLIVEMFPRLLKFVMQPAAYLVFHNTAEFFSIMVSLSMFGISWYTYEQSKNRHALFLGTAFLAIGIVDFMHAMSMPAMPDFITPNDPQKSVQFWIPVRLFQAVAFLASAYVYPDKPIRWLSKRILIASSLLVSSLVFTGIIFFQSHMPTFFVWGVGVTPLKKFCEYLVIFLLCAATGAYWRRMEITGDRLLIYYLAAFVVSIFSELPLAFYARAFDTYNVLGHINKIIAFFLIYYGIYRASVKDPYIRLAEIGQGLKREVAERKRTEEALQKSQEELEKRVEERTGDLQRANATLKAEIAERKRLEEELIESEEKSRLLIKYAPSMLYEIDFHRPAFKSVNDAMCQFMGYTREELLAMNPFDLLDEEGKALFRERIRRKLAGEAISDSVEYKSKTKDGREVHGALNISFTGKDGKPAGAVVVAHDITERKQMEAAIRRQNAVLQGINRIFEETLKSQTEEDLAKVYLNVAEEVTESKFGFIGEIGQDGLLHDIAISNPGWELCTMVDKTGHRRPPGDFKMHGLYGRVLQDGKSLFANTPG